MKCKITIDYGGADDGYVCFGDLKQVGGGFSLDYCFDGDACRLAYDGNALKQTRRGKFQTDITFIEGKQTACLTKDAEQGYEFLLNVFTYGISVLKNVNSLAIKINYKIEDNPVTLNLTAETDKENK